MATTFKVLSRAAAATSSATLYTVPAATTTLVTDIVIANTSASSGSYTLLFNDVSIAASIAIPANESINLSLKQVLVATNTIKGFASSTSIMFHISGVEIS
jgi:hypothetical protein